MNDQDGFDTRLAERFEREHRQVSADPFVATTMRKVRAGRRRMEFVRIGLRAAGLVAIIAASPWLIGGVERLNAALGASVSRSLGLPGAWAMGVVTVIAVLAMRVRKR
jgi:hypothetical protein